VPSYDAAPSHRLRNIAVVVVVLIVAAAAYALLRGGSPSLTVENAPTAIGQSKMLTVEVRAPAGVAAVEAHYTQNGKTIPVAQRNFSLRHWFSSGSAPAIVRFSFQVGKNDVPELSDGAAQLVVTARAANLRGSSVSWSRDLKVSTVPPRVYALNSQIYINQGGSAMAVYHVSDGAAESGVEMGGVFFPGYPLPNAAPGGAGKTMFALFAYPYNAASDAQPVLTARDAAGNQATASLPVKTFPRTFRSRTLEISDDFIERVVMPIIANMPELKDQHDPLKNFLMVNHDLRRTETQQLVDISKQSVDQFLWHGAFTALSNATVEAAFADHRSYRYHGQIVDQEDHLGYDLAVVRHTPVKAANAGRVVWAKYFGIYGNCILIDHGYGLMSLYAHLNDFEVKAGDTVAQGQLIAHSDSTGLAGGDHLHFSMLLDGVQVNPLEWWDPHWIHDRIEAPMQNAGQGSGARG